MAPPNLMIVPLNKNVVVGILIFVGIVIIGFAIWIVPKGIVRIPEGSVGIVFKKFSLNIFKSRSGLIALNGAPGWQPDLLYPGLKWIWPWMYSSPKEVPQVKVSNGKIALLIAEDGKTMPPGRTLATTVECDSFDNGRKFLSEGGEKGRQVSILTAGTYQINTKLFTVITADNAHHHGMSPEELDLYRVEQGNIGIVTTLAGKPIPRGEIAGSAVEANHDNFQNGRVFLDNGGYKGLQEEVLSPGYWNLNPWLVQVEQVPLTNIPPGTVGVVISFVGKTVPGASEKTLVEPGYKGTWKTPLYPGQHAINTKAMAVEIVPTQPIVLNWTKEKKPATNYDANLKALKLRSKDGFAFEIEVTQMIRISAEEAPTMISRTGSSQVLIVEGEDKQSKTAKYSSTSNLVARVLEPMVSAYFRNSAQGYEALDFLEYRADRQKEAADYIKNELRDYGVETDGTYINEIDLPDELEKILKERKIAQEMQKNYQQELETEEDRLRLIQLQAQKDMQIEVVRAQYEAQAKGYRAQGEAEEIRQIGTAEAEVLKRKGMAVNEAEIETIGLENFVKLQEFNYLSQMPVPHFLSMGGEGRATGFFNPIVATMLDRVYPNQQPALTGEAAGSQPMLQPTPEPRCAMALVLDTSASMSPEYSDALLEGIRTFQQELADDLIASRSIEIATITLGGSAQVTQTFVPAGEFSPRQLQLQGEAEMGRGVEIALQITANRRKTYEKQNLQHYQPWILLISGSDSKDNWQNAAQQVAQAISAQQLNCIAIGTPGADLNALKQITASAFPLRDLEFDSLFHWLANLMKKISRKDVLERLASAVEIVKSSLPPEKASIVQQCAEQLIVEASEPKT